MCKYLPNYSNIIYLTLEIMVKDKAASTPNPKIVVAINWYQICYTGYWWTRLKAAGGLGFTPIKINFALNVGFESQPYMLSRLVYKIKIGESASYTKIVIYNRISIDNRLLMAHETYHRNWLKIGYAGWVVSNGQKSMPIPPNLAHYLAKCQYFRILNNTN